MYSLRLASTGSTRLGFPLGRLGGRRSVSATSSAAAPVPGDQDVGMDPAKQHQPPPPQAPEGKRQDSTHTASGDDSFGEGYWTRADEEGFGGVYGRQNDPEDDTSKGSEEKEKEKEKAHAT